jgi:5-formyltetrahydrofolate cyclo-ligase
MQQRISVPQTEGNMDKTELRRQFKAFRENLAPDEVAAASAAICQRLVGWSLLQNARQVLTYLAFRNELNLCSLIDRLPGIRWAAPRVHQGGIVLHPYDPDRLVRHRFGMLEPAPDLPVIAPQEIDLVLVPGVGFDRHGGRIGFGGGYYDRFLPTTPALRVGIAYDLCLAESLPVTEYDQRMDWVVTPTQLIHCSPHWRSELRPL